MKQQTDLIKPVPWNTAALGLPAWELQEYSEAALLQALRTPGHHTARVDPLSDKRLLHEHGFYYCDTLIEPWCLPSKFRVARHADATVSGAFDRAQLTHICNGAFSHDHFHRDFKLPREIGERRFENWLTQLMKTGDVFGLFWQGRLSGFMALHENRILLNAVVGDLRGKGLSRYWWSEVCSALFNAGHDQVLSSISPSNIPMLNLKASLGFSFRDPQDIYHRLVP